MEKNSIDKEMEKFLRKLLISEEEFNILKNIVESRGIFNTDDE